MMPTRDDWQAATPRCPAKIGVGQKVHGICNRPLRSRYEAMDWCCSTHGSVLSWEDGGRRMMRLLGRMWFGEAA